MLKTTHEEPKNYLEKYNEVDELSAWIVDSDIYQAHADKLLYILRRRLSSDLPKSSKTLLKSLSANYTIENIQNWEFVYWFSSKQKWPILAKVFHKSVSYDPFPIALFYGDSKPGNLEMYFEKFIDEMNK